jgi:integrase
VVQGQGFVGDTFGNPVDGLLIAQSIERKESLKRRPLTPEELKRFIHDPAFQRERVARPERWWIVWLGLYAGLRREEAAQLRVDQVIQDAASGVWYLDVTDTGEGQRLKNAASRRRVPLHASLIGPLGFLDYFAKVKKGKHTRLFYQCKPSANGYGDAVGKWFSYRRDVLEFPEEVVFHSFRHGFITGLHAASVPDQLVFALCGHTGSGGEVHLGYTHRESFPLKTLSEAVNKLDFGVV